MIDINRKTSYDILVNVETNDAYSNIELNYLIDKNKADNPKFVRELTYGVLKNKYLLDYYINKFVKKVELKDRIILRMGIYQILFMNSVPSYAAINETVELSKKVRYGKSNFINGVLRNFLRKYNEIDEPMELWIKYSIEKWIFDLLNSQYENVEDILKCSNETSKLCIRVNNRKCNKDELSNRLIEKGFEVSKSNISNRSLIVNGSFLTNTSEFNEGLFSIQDESSTLCSDILLEGYDGKDELIIDTCAAPFGKTFATKELLSDESKIIACDVYDSKLQLIDKSIERLGLANISVLKNDSTKCIEKYIGKCDRVLCDVPCSGLGVLRRKPEIKYKKDADLDILIDTQKRILNASTSYLKENGILVYSTCTINKHENEEQIREFLENNKNYILEKEIKLLQTDNTDGFYIARLRKCK